LQGFLKLPSTSYHFHKTSTDWISDAFLGIDYFALFHPVLSPASQDCRSIKFLLDESDHGETDTDLGQKDLLLREVEVFYNHISKKSDIRQNWLPLSATPTSCQPEPLLDTVKALFKTPPRISDLALIRRKSLPFDQQGQIELKTNETMKNFLLADTDGFPADDMSFIHNFEPRQNKTRIQPKHSLSSLLNSRDSSSRSSSSDRSSSSGGSSRSSRRRRKEKSKKNAKHKSKHSDKHKGHYKKRDPKIRGDNRKQFQNRKETSDKKKDSHKEKERDLEKDKRKAKSPEPLNSQKKTTR